LLDSGGKLHRIALFLGGPSGSESAFTRALRDRMLAADSGLGYFHALPAGRLLDASLDESAAANLILLARHHGDGFRVGQVFFGQNPRGERLGVVGLQHRNSALQNNGSVIQMLIYKMHSAAGHLDAIVEGLLLGFKTREGRQKRWVNVENPVGKCGNELGRQKAHVPGEADQIDVVGAQGGDDIGIVLGASSAFGDEDRVR
jgi:hypothetical protein